MAVPFLAASAPDVALAQDGSYSVNETDLGNALSTLADESGRTIVYSASSVAGKHAARVDAAPTLDAALAAVLANSGLIASRVAAADYSAAALSEPDMRTTHPALWIDI